MRVLIIPDKFKGTLTAQQAAAAIAAGWRRARPHDHLDLLPMSDGGDGFGEVLAALLGARPQTVRTVDAAHRPVRATWWWDAKTRTAIIESARIIGLAMVPHGRFHPFELDTFGLGAVLLAAAKKGARHCLVGIGGSATNDGGFGLARALGWRFLAAAGESIESWSELHRLKTIHAPKRRRLFAELLIAVDVQNKLLGAHGCSRVYGPQKGLRPDDFPIAERNLRRLATVVARHARRSVATEPGAGAAGGLGFGLRAFVGGRFTPGFDLFARLAKLQHRMRSADLIITAEGCIDRSSLMGKGVGEVARRCRQLKLPCVGIGGVVNDRSRLLNLFTHVHALAPDCASPDEAREHAAFWLAHVARRVAGDWR
jgi:glycerate kinase